MKSATGLVYTKDMSVSANTTMIGEVVSVGSGRLLQDGSVVPLIVSVGDKVLYSKMQGESYTDETGDYTILSEAGVLAIIKE